VYEKKEKSALDLLKEKIEIWKKIRLLKAKDCLPLIERLEEGNLEEDLEEEILQILNQVDSRKTNRVCPICKVRPASTILVREGFLPVMSNICCNNKECKKTLMERVFEGENVCFEKLSVRNIQNLPKKFWKDFASILDQIFS
jgi:hypothetical protein